MKEALGIIILTLPPFTTLPLEITLGDIPNRHVIHYRNAMSGK
jgi:hypothetical protein